MAGGGGLFVEVGVMLVEGRLPQQSGAGTRAGPHAPQSPLTNHHHVCEDNAFLCERAGNLKRHMSLLSENRVPMCIDVFLCPDCPCGQARANATNICSVPSPHDLLLEQWTVSLVSNKNGVEVEGKALLQAIRSQLHFSQLGAWASLGRVPPVCYRLSHPGTHSPAAFARPPVSHHFPLAKTPRVDAYLKVSVKSLPRMESIPVLECPVHTAAPSPLSATVTVFKTVFAELGHCLLDPPSRVPPPLLKHGAGSWREKRTPSPPPRPPRRPCRPPLIPTGLVDDRLQSCCQHIGKHHCQDDDPPNQQLHNISYHHNNHSQVDKGCQSSSCSSMKSFLDMGNFRPPAIADSIINVFRSEVSHGARVNPLKRKRQDFTTHSKKLLSDQTTADLARSFNCLKIHSEPPPPVSRGPVQRRNLTLSTSPCPLRKSCSSSSDRGSNNSRQVTDSSSEDTECESPVATRLHPYPDLTLPLPPSPKLLHRTRPLLGSLEENLLGGRIKADAVVEDAFMMDIGASGAFCPKHLKLPATVSLFPVTGFSAPYMGVVKLSKKGYNVPRSGTIQATLFNPLGTVIKMFVVPYDLTDMPPNSHTFLRQRILAVSSLRYLIHLRFSSSKSGRVFLHTDIRVIIARQYDTDASVELDDESNCQLKSVIVEPSNPKYSTRK